MRHWDYRKKIAQIETVKAPLRGWVGKKGWTTQCPVSHLDRLLTSIAIIFISSGTLFMSMWGENNSCLVRKWRISQSIWDPLVACASKTWVRDKAAIKSTTTAVFSLAPHWAEVAASCIHKLPTGWEVRKKMVWQYNDINGWSHIFIQPCSMDLRCTRKRWYFSDLKNRSSYCPSIVSGSGDICIDLSQIV